MRYPPYIESDYRFPTFTRVRMRRPDTGIGDIAGEVNRCLDTVLESSGIAAGHRVAVGVGSRGITGLPEIVAATCRRLESLGAQPVIVPAMGSHGNATPSGQEDVLQALGITEADVGAPVLSAMDVVEVGRVFDAIPVVYSRDALDMDHAICINRIKPHTKFKGRVESGLMKMLVAGMGKHQGAMTYHRWAVAHGFENLLTAMADELVSRTNFRFGIAVVENEADAPMHIEAVAAGDLHRREPELLKMARSHFPRLPVSSLDVLVVGSIGKHISGSGMDPNVTGRAMDLAESDFSTDLSVRRVVVLRLAPESQGNAIGVGNADIITEKVFQSLDYEKTLMNALTSLSLHKAFIPVRMPTEKKAIQAGFMTIGPVPSGQVRAAIVRDTRHVAEFWASAALLPEIEFLGNASILDTVDLAFGDDGALELF